MSELISIVIPTYNHAHYLERCLKSIENQTIKNYEIILIDNHSIDNTKQIINKFKNLPIKYLLIKNEGIYAKSRNLGIKNSSGNIIAFLDSDDWWKNNKLFECYEYIKKGYDMVYHDLEVVNQDNQRKQKYLRGRVLKDPKFKLAYFDTCVLSTGTFISLALFDVFNANSKESLISIFL